MNKLILILFLTGYAFAGFNIKSDVNGDITGVVEGSPIKDAVYYSDDNQKAYDDAKALLSANPRDYLQIVDGKLAVKNQAEIDTIVASKEQAVIDANNANVDNLKITIKEAFVAWLNVYNKKVPLAYQVSKADLIAQVKKNGGL